MVKSWKKKTLHHHVLHTAQHWTQHVQELLEEEAHHDVKRKGGPKGVTPEQAPITRPSDSSNVKWPVAAIYPWQVTISILNFIQM